MIFKLILQKALNLLLRPKQIGLPVISAAELAEAKTDDWQYLQVLLDAYDKRVAPENPWNMVASFPKEPAILILYNGLYNQVMNGGFMQLIQNGYGGNLFNNPFTEDIASWGATGLAEVLMEAKLIYKSNQEYLERDRSIGEVAALYKEFKAFQPLEEKFFEVQEGQTSIIRSYVEQHVNQFVRVEQS